MRNLITAGLLSFCGLIFSGLAHATQTDCERTPGILSALEREVGKKCVDFTLTDLWNVQSLSADYKGITALQSADFSGLRNLVYLDISGNQLKQLPADVFSGLENLRELYLYENPLENLPEKIFSSQAVLDSLDLDGTKLETLPENIFATAPFLTYLSLERTGLKVLPPDVFKTVHLDTLWINGNALADLPSSLYANGARHLIIDGDVGTLPRLAQIPRLLSLYLDNVFVRNLPLNISTYLPNLQRLRIGGADDFSTDLSDLPDGYFEGLPALTELDVRYLHFKTVRPELFRGLPQLVNLAIVHSEVEELPENLFWQFSNLTTIRLDSNRLSTLPPKLFDGLTQLNLLMLFDNLLPKVEQDHIRASLPGVRNILF